MEHWGWNSAGESDSQVAMSRMERMLGEGPAAALEEPPDALPALGPGPTAPLKPELIDAQRR